MNPSEPAILKLISDESTEWYLPSKHVTFTSTTGEPVEPAELHRLDDALLDRGDELPGDRATDDLVVELEAAAALDGLDADERNAELAVPTRLLLVPALGFGGLGDGLAIGNPHVLGLHLDAELSRQLLERDAEVRLAHAPQQRLVCLGVALDADRPGLRRAAGAARWRACPRRPSPSR